MFWISHLWEFFVLLSQAPVTYRFANVCQVVAHVSLIILCTGSESCHGHLKLSICNACKQLSDAHCIIIHPTTHKELVFSSQPCTGETLPHCEHFIVLAVGCVCVCEYTHNATFSQLTFSLTYQLLAYSTTTINTTDNVTSSSGSSTSII